jgi:hypothetical protein
LEGPDSLTVAAVGLVTEIKGMISINEKVGFFTYTVLHSKTIRNAKKC